jgi:hypothetical protein
LTAWLGFDGLGPGAACKTRDLAEILRRGCPRPVADTLKNLWLALGEADPETGRWEPAEIAATAPTATAARHAFLSELANRFETGRVPGARDTQYMRGRHDVEALWAVVPYALVLLLSLSRRAQAVPHKRGKPNFERTFVQEINLRLAEVYSRTFGRAATADTRRGTKHDGPATLWVQEIFRTAACRVAKRIQPRPKRGEEHRHPVVRAIRAVSMHARATLSSNLEAGHRAWKLRSGSDAPESA